MSSVSDVIEAYATGISLDHAFAADLLSHPPIANASPVGTGQLSNIEQFGAGEH